MPLPFARAWRRYAMAARERHNGAALTRSKSRGRSIQVGRAPARSPPLADQVRASVAVDDVGSGGAAGEARWIHVSPSG